MSLAAAHDLLACPRCRTPLAVAEREVSCRSGHRFDVARQGYVNLLRLGRPEGQGDLFRYPWGDVHLVLTEQADNDENIFELDAREILLCKHHPEATSARNLLPCTVRQLLTVGNRVRVELQCGTETLIAQIVPESMRALELAAGRSVVAVIKASAFRRLL